MSRPTYVYRVVVDRWPEWCPDGWERLYSDTDDWQPEPPAELRALVGMPGWPYDMVSFGDEAIDPDDYVRIVCPRRDRINYLSGAAANRWVRHALALGAEAHVERGTVTWVGAA